MKLFWLFMIASILSVAWFIYSSAGLELIALVMFIDIMAIWFFAETKQFGSIKNIILERIEMLERLTSDMFERLNNKNSSANGNKKDILEWLDKF